MAPGSRGKFSKPTRGGGKHYSRDVQPVDKDGNPVSMWRDPEDDLTPSEEEESRSGSGSEESSEGEDEAGPSNVPPQEMTREQRRAAAKARKQAAIVKKQQVAAQPGDLPPSESEEESDDDLPANPNHTTQSRSQAARGPAIASSSKGDSSELSRREREALQAQQARDRYMKLHLEGKTEEARADLERLAIVRQRREAERARKEAEREEKEARIREKAEQLREREKLKEAASGRGGRGGKRGGKK